MSSRTASKQFKAKELRETRGKVREELRKLGDKIAAEKRAMTPEERTSFDKLKTDFVAASQNIRSVEADMKELDDLVSQDDGGDSDAGGDDDPMETPSQNSAGKGNVSHRQKEKSKPAPAGAMERLIEDRNLTFQAWARSQYGQKLTKEQHEACQRQRFNPKRRSFDVAVGAQARKDRAKQYRAAMGVGSGSIGGDLVPQDFSYILDVALKDYSNVRGVCREITTDTGALLPWPGNDDTSNTGALLSENTQVSETDLTLTTTNFSAYKFTSNLVLVSNELMNDSAFNLTEFVAEQIGIRIARGQGTYFTTGTGSSQPNGIVTAATTGITSASQTLFTSDELINTYYKVNPAYRRSPSFGWMFSDGILAYVTLLKDALGRPLYIESFREGEPATIMGKPVYPNQFMAATPAAATTVALAGDFSKFVIRDVNPGVRIRKLEERYADFDQVGFVAFLRSDANTVRATAIQALVMHA